jgi:hypothetical protein
LVEPDAGGAVGATGDNPGVGERAVLLLEPVEGIAAWSCVVGVDVDAYDAVGES